MKQKIESIFDKLEREGRLTPVPTEDIENFQKAMEKAIVEGDKYRREQAKLIAEARRRIVF